MRVPFKSNALAAALCTLALIGPGGALAQKKAEPKAEFATRDEAQAMVKRGVAYIKKEGKEKAYAEISNKKGQFNDRDLYLVVYGLDGVVRAHGANEKMVSQNLLELKDVDGKPFVKERVELAQSKASFWQDYKFTNPVSKKIEPKQMYCERLEDTAVCGGVYRK